jgi:hypothetical protein
MKQIDNMFKGMVFTLMFIGLALAGATETIAQDSSGSSPCVAENNMEKVIAPEAWLEDLTCMFKRFEGMNTLHFKVAVKNISDKPQRFRVQIFLDNGKAVGGLIPRRVKDGLVEPGKTASFVYPVAAMPQKPHSIILKIGTAGM